MILDRHFDRHRFVDLEANGNQDCGDDKREKWLLHTTIIPVSQRVVDRASLGLLTGGPVACGLWKPP